jgi:glyoxylase-like metal-dependent hydrolase (beta-lactamase superfamily II)
MRRTLVLTTVVIAGALSIGIAAVQQPAAGGGRGNAPPMVQAQQIKPNLYMLTGGGGNTTVFIQADGITVIDTKNPGYGQPILDKIKEFSSKPIVRIINTHTHGDHVSGNVEFPVNIDIVVQANTAENMKKMAPVKGLAPPPPSATPQPTIFEQNNGKGMPKRTFTDRMTIGSGADEIDLFYFGRAHTNGDAWVLFPTLRVVSAGDVFAWNNQLPILDANNGGSGLDIPDTIRKADAALRSRADQIITGHSTVMTFDDLKKWGDFNQGFLDQMRAAKAAGKSIEQAAKDWVAPADFTPQNTQAAQLRLAANVDTIYNEIK